MIRTAFVSGSLIHSVCLMSSFGRWSLLGEMLVCVIGHVGSSRILALGLLAGYVLMLSLLLPLLLLRTRRPSLG